MEYVAITTWAFAGYLWFGVFRRHRLWKKRNQAYDTLESFEAKMEHLGASAVLIAKDKKRLKIEGAVFVLLVLTYIGVRMS